MYAILETGGKQIKAIPGQNIDIEKLPQNKGEKVSLNNVLMLVTGKDSKMGNPYIKGASVKGHLVEQAKDDKVIVYKMRPKKGTRKKQGHRQWYSRVFVESIELDGKSIATAEKTAGKGLINQTSTKKKEESKTEITTEEKSTKRKKVKKD